MRALVIDDHPLIREILPVVLRKAMGEETLVDVAQNFEGGLECAGRCAELDLVLLDLGLPGFTGIEALRRFREKHPNTKVVVISANDERESIQAAFKAGAKGYIPKTSTPEMIVAALKVVMAGGVYVPKEALNDNLDSAAELSERQHEVLRLILNGLPNSKIAQQLRMAENTVKHHASAIYDVLGVKTRAEAIATALRNGFKPR